VKILNTSLCRGKNLTHMFTLARQVQMPESRDMSSFRLKLKIGVTVGLEIA